MGKARRPRAVFVSGGAGGIGLVTARLFVERGWRVGVGDLDPGRLDGAAAAGGLDTFVLDVRDPLAWDRVLADFCGPSGGALDALVNNAGVLTHGWFYEQDPGAFDLAVDVNLKGVLYGARAGVERLRLGVDACLVNIASAAALTATPRQAVYSATKFAVRGLSEALDIEFMRLGVRVACVEPFLVDTPMLDCDDARGRNYRDIMQGQAFLDPDDVARAVWDAVHGTALHYPVGAEPTLVARRLDGEVEARRARWRQILKL